MPQHLLVPRLDTGIIKHLPRHAMPEGSFYISDGMALFKSELCLAPGFRQLQDTPQQLAGSEVMHLDEFPMETGITHLMAFSDDKAYRYDSSSDTFVNITRQSLGVDVDYTGDLDDVFQADTVVNPGGDLYFVVTNSKKDPVTKWDGNTGNRMTKLGGSPTDGGDHFSRSVASFMNMLLHLNRTEGGTALPRRLRWSDNGIPETYSGGTAGFLNLFQGADHGMRLAGLANYMTAYRERSIHLISFVGSPFVFAQRQVVSGIGLLAQRALLNLDVRHVFLGNDNVYIFNGVDIEPIATQIRDELFDTIDPAHVARSMMGINEPRNEMSLVVPTAGSGGIPDTWWYWDIARGTWSGPVKNRPCTALGVFERRATKTWDTATGTWDSQVGPWDTASNLLAFEVSLFGNLNRRVYQIDPTVVTADGVAVPGRMESAAYAPGSLFDPPVRDAVCTEILPLMAESGANLVNWYVGTSENPTGPFTFQGPFTRGVRGEVKTKPIRGKWFVFAAEASIAWRISGFIVDMERGGY